MELRIEPEPSPEERAAIEAALEQVSQDGPGPSGAWSRPDVDDEPDPGRP